MKLDKNEVIDVIKLHSLECPDEIILKAEKNRARTFHEVCPVHWLKQALEQKQGFIFFHFW